LNDSQTPENPYAPPSREADAAWAPASSPLENPVAPTSLPKTLGILSIIFASIVLFFGLFASCGGFLAQGFTKVGQLAPRDNPHAQEIQETLSVVSSIYTAIGFQGLILAVMSSILLAVGVGQMRYRRWAARWTIYWAAAALVAIGGMVAISFFIIGPAYQRMFLALAKASPSGAMPMSFTSSMSSIFGGSSGLLTILFYAPYPILLLIFFSRDHVRAAMDR
jgi:hypothetical protein